MPQLDFFTFNNQFIYLIACFSGLYYFNLLILFPKIKWFFLNKFYLLRFYTYEIFLENTFYKTCFGLYITLSEYYISFGKLYSEHNSLILIFKKISFLELKNSSTFYTTVLITTLLSFLFLKNLIVFNAEKLMFIYFLILFIFILNLSLTMLKSFLQNDIIEFLSSLYHNELLNEHFLNSLIYFNKYIQNIVKQEMVSLLLLTNFRLKKINND